MDSDGENFLAYMRGPSPTIPGLTGSDVIAGTHGQGKLGHSLYENKNDNDRERLQCPELHARLAFWLRPRAFSLKEIKMECKSQSVPTTGNKKILALKLAFKNLPADVGESVAGGYSITHSSPNKQGGKRVKTGSKTTSGTGTDGVTKAKKRKSEGAKKVPIKAKRKIIEQVVVAPEPAVDEKCNKCGEGEITRCEGRNCNAVTLCCDCNDCEFRNGVSYCTECETGYCHRCRLRFGMGCTSCQMMAESAESS